MPPQVKAEFVPVSTPRRPSVPREPDPKTFREPDPETIKSWEDAGWSYNPTTGGFDPNPGTMEKFHADRAAESRFLLAASPGPVASHPMPPPRVPPVASHQTDEEEALRQAHIKMLRKK
jgi:hypothetical protein